MSTPYPVTMTVVSAHDYDRAVEVESTDHLVDLLSLTKSSSDIEEAISDKVVNGRIFATLCPYAMDVHGDRKPIFASTRDELDNEYHDACEDI